MHHNDLYDSVKTKMPGENLVLALNAEMFLANYIAGFLNFNISQTIGVIKLLGDKTLIFCSCSVISMKVINWSLSVGGCGLACPGMPKEAFGGQSCYAYIARSIQLWLVLLSI